MLRQTKRPAMMALSFGLFTASSSRWPACRDSKLATIRRRSQKDAGIVMPPLGDNEPDWSILAQTQGSISEIDRLRGNLAPLLPFSSVEQNGGRRATKCPR